MIGLGAGMSMLGRIFLFLFAFRGIAFGATAHTDTIPPAFSWVSPTFLSIITTNTIRVAVDAHDNPDGSGIDRVRFFATYLNDNSLYSDRIPIGEVTSEPYEIIWDCSRIPDQNFWKLSFSCEVRDRAGNVSVTDRLGAGHNASFVLDRNPIPNNSELRSFRTRRTIHIDGDLGEWALNDSIRFANNDNTVAVYSLWDRSNLYFGIRVADQSIIGTHTAASKNIEEMPTEDIAELYLDARHDHSAVFADGCRHYLVSAAGKIYEERSHLDKTARTFNPYAILHPRIPGKCMVKGTLNVEGDIDRCYLIEIAIPWSELGISPRSVKRIGLEVWNSDRDFRYGRSSYAGWTTTASNLKNPSEWGDLVLVDDRALAHAVTIFSFPVLAGIAGTLLYITRNRRRKISPSDQAVAGPPEAGVENEHIRRARLYIEEHYREDTLSRDEIARHVGLNASYFGKLFKAESGEYLSDYLVNLRIEKAKALLHSTPKNISEIAFEVGFNSQSYFGCIFKRKEGCSPKEYRAARR